MARMFLPRSGSVVRSTLGGVQRSSWFEARASMASVQRLTPASASLPAVPAYKEPASRPAHGSIDAGIARDASASAASLSRSKPLPADDLLTYLFQANDVSDDAHILTNVYDESRSLTKGALRDLSKRLIAGWLHGLKISSGVTITCCAFNDVVYPALFYGIVGAGALYSGVNPSSTTYELSNHFRMSRTSYIVCDPQALERVSQAARECCIPLQNIVVLDTEHHSSLAPYRSWTYLLQHGQSDWTAFKDHTRCRDTALAVVPTSGTTGAPKMAVRTHANVIAECEGLRHQAVRPYSIRRLVALPFFHGFAFAQAMTSGLRYGLRIYVMDRFRHDDFLSAISRHQINETAVAPVVLATYFTGNAIENREKLKSIKTLYVGSAPLNVRLQERAQAFLSPGARISQVYGLTEAGIISYLRYPELDASGSVGTIAESFEARVVGRNGDLIKDGESGELQFRGPNIFREYAGNAQASLQAKTTDGWFKTGDLGYIKDGKIYVTDRIKDIIKVKGWQVSPSEIESVLVLHPDVQQAAVIGVKSQHLQTEIPRAFIVLRPQASVTRQALKSFMAEYLSGYKVRHCEIVYTSTIPRNSMGKIVKSKLPHTVVLENTSESGCLDDRSPRRYAC